MKKGLIGAISGIAGACAGAYVGTKLSMPKADDTWSNYNRLDDYYHILIQWISDKQQGKSLESYFVKNNFKTVAVYGVGQLGELLCDELNQFSEVSVKYGIDKMDVCTVENLDLYSMDDELPEVDVVIVTPVFAFDEIKTNLEKKVDCSIVSLKEIF